LKTLFPFETFTFLCFRHHSDISISHKKAQKAQIEIRILRAHIN
jgi:hypothetical protein